MTLVEELLGQVVSTVDESSADLVLDRMVALCECEGAIDLRLGEYIALFWDNHLDMRKVCFSNRTAFATELLDMDRSWAFRLAALGGSDLFLVKTALCRNVIPISTAVLAPKQIEPGEQVDWVQSAMAGDIRPRRSAKGRRVDIDDREDAKLVDEQRRKARTIMGYPCSDEAADRHILAAWRNKIDGRALVRRAQEPRDPPPKKELHWDPKEDPAAAYLGPRVMPRDEDHALELLEDILRRRRMRTIELGIWYGLVVERKLYVELGYRSVEEMVRETLPVSIRTLQGYAKQAEKVTFYPELEAALQDGMDLSRIFAVYEIATEDNVARWLAVARRTGVTEIRRATTWATDTIGDFVLERYEWAIVETNDAHSWVAIKAARQPPKPPGRIEGVDPDLVEACTWYRDHVPLPKFTGFAKVKEREHCTCENPLCNVVTLRLDGHHKKPRRHGGGNEDANASALCRPCHGRGVHADGGFTQEVDAKGRDVWTYPNGRRVVVF
jgi:hypothetical protein